MAIGERIRFFRNLKGITQKYLGMVVGFPERFYQKIAQLFGGDFGPAVSGVVLGVVVPPAVIVLLGDLPGLQLRRLFPPRNQDFVQLTGLTASLENICLQAGTSIHLYHFQTVNILQGEQRMGQTYVVVYVRDAQRLGRYICLLYTSPSPRDRQKSRMPSSA